VVGLLAEGRAEVVELHQHAEDVLEGEVRFLDVHGGVGGDDDVDVGQGLHGAAVVAGVGDGVKAEGAGELEGADAVLAVAAGRDGEEDVAGLAEGFDLALEDVVEGVVVADGGEDAGVGGEGDGAKGGAVDGEAGYEFGDEVLGVGCGASVAADEELVAGLHGVGGDARGFDDSCVDGLVVADFRHGVDGQAELTADEVDHGAVLPGILLFRILGGALAEVGVVAGDPVLAGWGEDVEVDGVFEGLGGVRQVGGDDEDFAGTDDHVDGGALFA
jgi:hypothetical protein